MLNREILSARVVFSWRILIHDWKNEMVAARSLARVTAAEGPQMAQKAQSALVKVTTC